MVVTMTSDFWESVVNDDRVVSSPNWMIVDHALSQLDGTIYTLVTFDDDRGSTLFVGGSSKGVVIAWSQGDHHLIARRGEGLTKILVTVGGQAGDYASRNVIPIDVAKYITKGYFDGLNIKDLAEWEHS